MFEERDDTLPRPGAILNHFRQNIQLAALTKMRKAFEEAWNSNTRVDSPLDFKVIVWFDRVLPDDVKRAVESELTTHGWTNYTIEVRDNPLKDHPETVLNCKLDPEKAKLYA